MRFQKAAAGMVVVVFLMTGATYVRNRVWDTKLSLWRDAAKKSPRKSRTRNNLGNCYMLLEKPFSAIREYRKAISLDAGNIEAYHNIAVCLEQVGIVNQAQYYYDMFCKTAPRSYQEQRQVACERAGSLSRKMAGREYE